MEDEFSGVWVGVFLGEDTRYDIISGVGFQDRFEVWIEVAEDRGGSKGSFQLVENSFAFRGPEELSILSEQVE